MSDTFKCVTDGCNRDARRKNGRCEFHYRKNLPGKRCYVDECDSRAIGRGLCSKHWQRWKKHGNPTKTERIRFGYGRKKKNQYGYILVYVPGHPMANGDNFCMEHRLVMSNYLGRSLEKFENVHHKNGVRDDNRIENLELWVVRQPQGQRVEDLLEYAEWIISKYGGDAN